MIYSFDLAIAAGDSTDNNAARKTWEPNLYQPDKLDTDQWLAAGAAKVMRGCEGVSTADFCTVSTMSHSWPPMD